VTGPPVAFAFFDHAHDQHGMWRSGLTLLFENEECEAVSDGPEVTPDGDGFRTVLPGRFDLVFTPVVEPAALRGARLSVCRVEGTLGARSISCVGTTTAVTEAPEWAELDVLRELSAVFDGGHAMLAIAQRPRGSVGHGGELVSAAIAVDGVLLDVEEARLSTVYDGEGRQRSCGVELWLPGEDFPRRASGEVVAGTTLDFSGLRVNAAIFRWRMDGREGAGSYELTVRDEREAA